jgi:hypothetical protein
MTFCIFNVTLNFFAKGKGVNLCNFYGYPLHFKGIILLIHYKWDKHYYLLMLVLVYKLHSYTNIDNNDPTNLI